MLISTAQTNLTARAADIVTRLATLNAGATAVDGVRTALLLSLPSHSPLGRELAKIEKKIDGDIGTLTVAQSDLTTVLAEIATIQDSDTLDDLTAGTATALKKSFPGGADGLYNQPHPAMPVIIESFHNRYSQFA